MPDGNSRRAGLTSFADGGLDLGRIAAAAAVCGMVATGMIVSGAADAASVALLTVISALLTCFGPRPASQPGCAARCLAQRDRRDAGAALVVLLVSVPPALLIRGSGRPLALAVVGPLLGTLGMAPFLPCWPRSRPTGGTGWWSL